MVKDIREQGRCTILTEGSTLYWYRISGNKVDVLYSQKAVHRTVVQDIREQGRCTIPTEGSTSYCGTGYQGTR